MPKDLPQSHGLLSPLQKAFLAVFATLPDQGNFYLSGGTALAEFYLGHRLSYDLDLFTGIDGLVLPVSYQLETLHDDHQLSIQVVRRFATYVEFQVSGGDEGLKVVLALDAPFRFLPSISCTEGFEVNNFTDLSIDKLLAFYGRAEQRDAVDLYFILQHRSAGALFEQARQKDSGFDAYWFAVALNRCQYFPDELERWPVKMLLDWNPKDIKALFKSWAMDLMRGLEQQLS